MYVAHPKFETPPDDVIIWRYMSLWKFTAMVQTNALYFAQAKNLEDPYEGTFSALTREALRAEIQPRMEAAAFRRAMDNFDAIAAAMPHNTYVNCWHMSPYESAAMWSIYGPVGNGIAIRSTVGRLRAAILDKREIFIGLVKYADFSTLKMDLGNLFVPYTYKRFSFEFEKELRAVFWLALFVDQVDPRTYVAGAPPGQEVAIDLSGLIDAILVDPKTSQWQVEVVRAICDKYAVAAAPTRSDLLAGPK